MGLKILGAQIFLFGGGGGVKILNLLKFRFSTIIIFVIFWTGVKIHKITLKRIMTISADIFVVLLRCF